MKRKEKKRKILFLVLKFRGFICFKIFFFFFFHISDNMVFKILLKLTKRKFKDQN
jgi:hypothetical protein